ncbi:hypothetical protein QQ045_023487 [Rhodiola kirilowii]
MVPHGSMLKLNLCPAMIGFEIRLNVSDATSQKLSGKRCWLMCKARPQYPLYNGGILKNQPTIFQHNNASSGVSSPAILLQNLTHNTYYCLSGWVKIKETVDSGVLIKASLAAENTTVDCIGSATAQSGCWSFLKGGFYLSSPPSSSSNITFQSNFKNNVTVSIASFSLQPFTEEEWRFNQHYTINKVRKRAVTVHVSDSEGEIIQGAKIQVHQTSKEFPFGSAIAKTILGNLPYQVR